MTPLEFLAFMLVMTAVAAGVHTIRRRRHMAALRRLAGEAGMHFTAADRFRLAPRIAQRLPVPGAAAVRVLDLIYGVERENYRYVFSTEYTIGVLRSKRGVRRVVAFAEPRDPAAGMAAGGATDAAAGVEAAQADHPGLAFAPDDLPVLEQYRHLLGQFKSA